MDEMKDKIERLERAYARQLSLTRALIQKAGGKVELTQEEYAMPLVVKGAPYFRIDATPTGVAVIAV